MKFDILVAGIGGQGILTVAAVLARAAHTDGLFVKQFETHGMSQRAGSVVSHVRIADKPVDSTVIPKGKADLIIALEPVEGIRYQSYLAPSGKMLVANTPARDLPDYPSDHNLSEMLGSGPNVIIIEAEDLAHSVGARKAANVVLLGAASVVIPVTPDALKDGLAWLFRVKGERILKRNLEAFQCGRQGHL